MKKVSLIAFLTIMFGYYSCIPSLHGLLKEEDRMTDERILGKWILEEDESDNFKLNGSIKYKEGSQAMENYEQIWLFERAGDFTFETPDKARYMSVTNGTRSMKPRDMMVTKETLHPYYFLTHYEVEGSDTTVNIMQTELTEIGSHLYIDLFPNVERDELWLTRFANNTLSVHTFARIEFNENMLNIRSFNPDYISALIKNKRIRLKHEVYGDDEILLTASTEDLRAFIKKYEDDPKLYEEYSEALYKM